MALRRAKDFFSTALYAAQSVARLTLDQEIQYSIPGPATYVSFTADEVLVCPEKVWLGQLQQKE